MPSSTAHCFTAMGSPCEVQMDGDDPALVARLGQLAEAEVARIEAKYSRYRPDSVVSAINSAAGQTTQVDAETRALLAYADQCWRISHGLFDISSGVLRRIWRFDGSDNLPSLAAIRDILPLVGWSKVGLDDDSITLRPGMEIDFGGLAKEYAVDRVALLLAQHTDAPLLVNFGGDLRVSGPRRNGQPWRIAIEAVEPETAAPAMLEIRHGALTTSGDARRYLLKNGVRFGHILNPITGWPVVHPPRSVTVAAASCMEAGILSTLAMAHGAEAETFLEEEACVAWVIR